MYTFGKSIAHIAYSYATVQGVMVFTKKDTVFLIPIVLFPF